MRRPSSEAAVLLRSARYSITLAKSTSASGEKEILTAGGLHRSSAEPARACDLFQLAAKQARRSARRPPPPSTTEVDRWTRQHTCPEAGHEALVEDPCRSSGTCCEHQPYPSVPSALGIVDGMRVPTRRSGGTDFTDCPATAPSPRRARVASSSSSISRALKPPSESRTAAAPGAPDRADDDGVSGFVDRVVEMLLRSRQQDTPDRLAVAHVVDRAQWPLRRHRCELARHVLELSLEHFLSPRPILPQPRRNNLRSLQCARGQFHLHRLVRRSAIASARSINCPDCSSVNDASSSRCNAARSSSSRSSLPRANTSLS